MDAVPLGLAWQAPRPLTQRYTVFVHLLDEQGRRWAGRDQEPLGGSEPTTGWPAGRTIEDRSALVLPDDIPPGEYTLVVGLYPSGNPPQRLTLKGAAGNPPSQTVSIGRIRVVSRAGEEVRPRHLLERQLGDDVALLGYDLDIDVYRVESTRILPALLDLPIELSYPKRMYRPADSLIVTLYWRATGPVVQDYTVFVQALDRSDHLWGQVDSQPVRGDYPTSRWSGGNVVVDRHELRLDPATPPGDLRLVVGMYLLSTMERLPVISPGGDTVTDAVALQTIRVEPQ